LFGDSARRIRPAGHHTDRLMERWIESLAETIERSDSMHHQEVQKIAMNRLNSFQNAGGCVALDL
jgi:hypothetical protein